MNGTDGIPRPFQTKAEILDYLGSDTIECLICGRRLTVLSPHLRARHSLSADDYRLQFGIPFSYGLAGQRFCQTSRERMLALYERGAIAAPDAEEVRDRFQNTGERRPACSAVRQADIEKLLRNRSRREQWRPQDFAEFLHRVESGRSVSDVGREADMPSAQTFFKYIAKHPPLKARYDRVRQSQPLSVQARTRRTGSLYRETIARLRNSGLTWTQISAITGVKSSTLRNAWRKIATG
ncbi:MucR family transcriptional regulator [Asticcacaulis solisilvae]|uniref:MucR family transcriptional regulator n=1 Tax=Asticcacaulis solisilvae TaxID=1217274 RepID=UPI003FD7B18D